MASEEDVKAIRDWLLKQPHLPQNIEKRLLVNFLFCCDGSLEQTKACLELFFTCRADCPEVFNNRDPLSSEIQHTFNIIELCPLPKLTPEGYGCLVFRFADPDPDKFHFYDFVKTFFMVGDMRARSETELVAGLVPILDMTGWSLRHLAKAPLTAVRKYLKYCQEAQPVKLKQIHVINATNLFDKMFTIIRPFVKNEVASAIRIHPIGSDSLYDYVPKEILPKEFGGQAGTMEEIKEANKKKVEAERAWFLTNEWEADENKRVGQRTDRPAMEGSFRTLAID